MRKGLWMRGMALLCSLALLLTGAVNVHAEAPSQETTELSEDVEAPRVQNVSMDRAGEIINTGDSVNLTVEATDDREMERVSVCMKAAESEGKQQDIQLTRVEGTDRYEGSFKVLDNTYPCEWYIESVDVYDKAGNHQCVNGYKDGSCTGVNWWDRGENAYLLEEKYYVNVMRGSTFVESTTHIGVMDYRYGKEDGSLWGYELSGGMEVPRRAKLSVIKELCKTPNGCEGLVFEGWVPEYGSYDANEDREILWTHNNICAKYDKNVVILWLSSDPWDDEPVYSDEVPEGYFDECIGMLVGQAGETVSLPAEVPGFKNVKWEYQFSDVFEQEEKTAVTGNTIVIGDEPCQKVYGSAELDPDAPSAPTTPSAPTAPSAPDTPVRPSHAEPVALSERQIAEAAARVKSAGNGTAVTVAMGDATVVPKGILEAAKGKDVDVVLQMDGYFWTINGKDILSSNLKDINLKVIRNTEYIPSSRISQLAGTNPVEQITLEYEGDFGFTADLTMNIGSQYAGKTGNLYWHDSDGRMIFMNAGAIDGAGNVTLGFSHASDYAIVITDSKAATASNTAAASVATPAAVAPKTGDELPVVPYAVLCMIGLTGLLTVGIAVKRRRTK